MNRYRARFSRALVVVGSFVAAIPPSAAAASADAPPRQGAPADSTPLLWPLAERTCVTGSFCEYRTGHFHAGIDISTRGSIGLPVRAVADGRVVRLRASPYGYGRAIYYDIEGSDGGAGGVGGTRGVGSRTQQVVCAHLSDFASRWRALVEAEQERHEKYTVDFAVADSPRVAVGEIIAYTGDSGAGPPHLHFEVRDGDADPINPLTRGWEAPMPDTTPPTIRSVRLVPLGLEGRVEGGLDPVIVPAVRESAGRYRAARTVAVRGPVGVEVNAADRIAGCDAARGIFAASLSLDGAELFASEFAGVSYYGDWADVEVRYDYGAHLDGAGEFVRLFNPIGPRIGRVGVIPSPLEGEHALSIRVSDEAGNEALCELVARGEVASIAEGSASAIRGGKNENAPPSVSWRSVPEGLVIRLENRGATDPDRLVVQLVNSTEPSPYELPTVATSPSYSWFVVEAATLARRPPRGGFWSFGAQAGDVEVRVDRQGNLPVGENSPAPHLALGPFIAARESDVAEIRAVVGGARVVIAREGLHGHALLTGSATPIAPVLPPGLVGRSAPARFDPPDALLKKPAEVRFAIPESLRPISRRLAVYSVGRRGGVASIGGGLDAATGEFVATTRHLATFVLLEDASPPRLSIPRPAPGAVITNALPRLSVRGSDVGEGLDDEGVRFTIDDTRLIPEYDPEAGTIVARPKTPLAAGPHRMEVHVADKAGNDTSIVSRFTITAGATGGAKSGKKASGGTVKKPAPKNPKGKKP